MIKDQPIWTGLFVVLTLLLTGCNSYFGFGQQGQATSTPEAATVALTEAEIEKSDTDEAELAATVEPTAEPTEEMQVESDQPLETVVEASEAMTATETLTSAESLTGTVTATVQGEPVDFTGEIGLNTFSSYRLRLSAVFSGTRQGQPAEGRLEGLFEVTRNPESRHWQMEMEGDTINELTALGTMIDLYDINGLIYMKNPQDGSWLAVPAFLVKGLIPEELYTPEDYIRLPATALLMPGEEDINGVTTRRYSFTEADIMVEEATYDQIEGTIWVAVEGNYVVRYEAAISSQQEKLTVGGIELLDSGTATIIYDVSDVNSRFIISPPG